MTEQVMTKEEFERIGAERAGITVEEWREMGHRAVVCDCDGWKVVTVDQMRGDNPWWVYCPVDIIAQGMPLLDCLTEMGSRGWELVLQNDEQVYIFKKRLLR